MGKLVDGKWLEASIITADTSGRYDRQPRTFLNDIHETHSDFLPQSNRYHLYISHACPWATRVMMYRSLKELVNHISFSVVHPDMLEKGWTFSKDFPGSTGDDLYGLNYLYQLYQKAQKDISTSVTVPILWDKHTKQIVNNESSQIIRIFNQAFNQLTGNTDDYYPESLRSEIDQWNDLIYNNVNNGVYRVGFAQNQVAYDTAVSELFTTLDHIDQHLKDNDYLVGNQLTEADLRLIPTLLRFDLVYYVHFKTNLRKIMDYKYLSQYTQRMYAIKAVSDNHHFDHIKRHYYYSHEMLNPNRIVPIGPEKYI
ncbi:MAG: glutathione S-transferase C-terminal domain-containing protein [Pseudomonadota bacterium]|nr:glutathione S-transferase C-terminal domain-containing protein [Pseudomonadota bacterium]